MDIAARDAIPSDLPRLEVLYAAFAEEQAALRPLWREAQGLTEPAARALEELVEDGAVTVGVIDDVAVGFLVHDKDPLVDGAGTVGVFRYIYTEPEARGVGVADAMFVRTARMLADAGVAAFDAVVSPGHREAKNFYEAHGFSARRITMHATDPLIEGGNGG